MLVRQITKNPVIIYVYDKAGEGGKVLRKIARKIHKSEGGMSMILYHNKWRYLHFGIIVKSTKTPTGFTEIRRRWITE